MTGITISMPSSPTKGSISGQVLAGRYELRGVLGRGGMAEVHDGWDTRLNRAVAIKVMYLGVEGQPGYRERFQGEARAAAALNHRHVVAVHDFGDDNGRLFIVLERLPGATVADEIAKGPLSQERVYWLLDQVLAALGTAHDSGILHRDIKPGNILLTANGESIKVADFGLAKTAGAAYTLTGQIVGTLAYLSPERIAGAPASVTDDIYALGVLGYEALAGHRPFRQDDNLAAFARAVVHEHPTPLTVLRPDVDPQLIGVIQQAMARDPQKRFSTAAEMRAALHGHQPFLASKTPRAAAVRLPTKVLDSPPLPPLPGTFVPPGTYIARPRPRRARLSSRRKRLLGAAAVLVVLAVCALALAFDTPTTGPAHPASTSTSSPSTPPPPQSSTLQQPATQAGPGADQGNNGNKGGKPHKGGKPGKG